MNTLILKKVNKKEVVLYTIFALMPFGIVAAAIYTAAKRKKAKDNELH